MPSQISWLLDRRVIFVKFTGEVTVEDLQSFNTSMHEYLDLGQPPLVHIISDSSETNKFPINLGALNKVFFQQRPNPKMGWIVVITANRMLSFVSSMLAQLGKSRFRTFNTMQEAIAFLNDIDVTLPTLVPPDTEKQS